MSVDFSKLNVGEHYSRHDLADAWGYSSFHALARGVVTPANDDKIVLFVTKDKQESAEQYKNELRGSQLDWEGPTDHFAEQRMLKASTSGEQIHVFYRNQHHSNFTYLGQAQIAESAIRVGQPSSFTLDLETAARGSNGHQ